MEIAIGRSNRGRRAASLDEIAVVPSRRTRGPEQVSLDWQIDAYSFQLPFIGAPMDSVTSPATAIELGRLGGLGVLAHPFDTLAVAACALGIYYWGAATGVPAHLVRLEGEDESEAATESYSGRPAAVAS